MQQGEHHLRALLQLHLFENALFFFHAHLHVAADEVDQKAEPVDAFDGVGRFRRYVGVHFDEFHRKIPQAFHHGLAFLLRQGFFNAAIRLHFGFQVRLLLHHLLPFETLLSLQDHRVGAVRHLEHFEDSGDRAHFVEVVRAGHFSVVFLLAHHPDHCFGFVRFLDQPNRAVPAYADGDDHTGKEHCVSEREKRKNLGDVFLLHGLFVLLSQDGDELLILRVAQFDVHGLHCRGRLRSNLMPHPIAVRMLTKRSKTLDVVP